MSDNKSTTNDDKLEKMGYRESTKILHQKEQQWSLEKEEKPLEITLRNHKIPRKESTQFIGMTLDSRLNWEENRKQ